MQLVCGVRANKREASRALGVLNEIRDGALAKLAVDWDMLGVKVAEAQDPEFKDLKLRDDRDAALKLTGRIIDIAARGLNALDHVAAGAYGAGARFVRLHWQLGESVEILQVRHAESGQLGRVEAEMFARELRLLGVRLNELKEFARRTGLQDHDASKGSSS